MDVKRVFLIVLDSVGIGELPDAAEYGDAGSNTIGALVNSGKLAVPNLEKLGLFQIEGDNQKPDTTAALASFARMSERSKGKDTTIGHWEIAGIISENPLPTYPKGFPKEVIEAFSKAVGRGVLCNLPYSGTQVLKDYGKQHMETGDLIVYTSADSVFQIAAHEEIVPVSELYQYCEIAREQLQGKHGVGRVIARPFIGADPNFQRTSNRHDYSLLPPKKTICDLLTEHGLASIGIGKIHDIFAGKGISETTRTTGNDDGMKKTIALLEKDFTGLAFINLVDFDMLYGHRNDVLGYTEALNHFDAQLGEFLPRMKEDDLLLITADHGCDPATPSTDHSREYTPLLIYGDSVKQGVNLGTRSSFSDIAATIADIFHLDSAEIAGESFWNEIRQS